MIEKIWEMIQNNREDYRLLSNGIEVENCEYGYYYFNRKTREYVTIGLDKGLNVVYILFEKQPR